MRNGNTVPLVILGALLVLAWGSNPRFIGSPAPPVPDTQFGGVAYPGLLLPWGPGDPGNYPMCPATSSYWNTCGGAL